MSSSCSFNLYAANKSTAGFNALPNTSPKFPLPDNKPAANFNKKALPEDVLAKSPNLSNTPGSLGCPFGVGKPVLVLFAKFLELSSKFVVKVSSFG